MFYYWKVQQMVYRASYKPRKRKEKPSKCQCNAKAIKSEATARKADRADVRASENMKESDF